MKPPWRTPEVVLTARFVKALLVGGGASSGIINPNQSGSMNDFDEASLREVITEGRRQLDGQADSFRHATDRAQLLLTVTLVAIGFEAATFGKVTGTSGWIQVIALVLWGIGFCLTILGFAAAASVVVMRAQFMDIDTTQVSTWASPVLHELAKDYAESVRMGAITVADRVTVFRQATRLVVWGTVLGALSLVLALAE
jgi:hypothetical protein